MTLRAPGADQALPSKKAIKDGRRLLSKSERISTGTTGALCLRRTAITSGPSFKWASTSSGRRQCHPLAERHIGIIAAFEHFEKAHRAGAGVLDIMPHGEGHIADITGLKIEC